MDNEKLAQHAEEIKKDTRIKIEEPKEKPTGTDKKRSIIASGHENQWSDMGLKTRSDSWWYNQEGKGVYDKGDVMNMGSLLFNNDAPKIGKYKLW